MISKISYGELSNSRDFVFCSVKIFDSYICYELILNDSYTLFLLLLVKLGFGKR